MVNHASDQPGTCCPTCQGDGYLLEGEPEKLRADARALWAYRVRLAFEVRLVGEEGDIVQYATRRFRELPADVRAKLGECP